MSIPNELKQLKQWIELPPGKKYPTAKGWQDNSRAWDDIQEPNGKGFLLAGTPYLCIDGDHVLQGGAFVSEWAEQFFARVLETGTYVERSVSGTGIHVFYRLDQEQHYGGELERLKGMSANGGTYNYWLPGFDDAPKETRPHIEIFYNARRQIYLTGKAMGGDTVKAAPSMLNDLLKRMAAFIVPAGLQSPQLAQSRELPPDYENERAAAMLNCIDPAGLDYHDWVKVGQILHDLGADVSLWDEWSQRDPGRYKGSREITSKWASFRGSPGGSTIATLHTMAKAGGYDEKTFQRDWFASHPVAPPIIRKAEPINPWAAGVSDLIESVEANDYDPIPTGIATVDEMLGGGLMRKKLYLIGAAPAMGKTALTQQLAEHLVIRNPDVSVLYFCFEMPRAELQARSVARLGHSKGKNLSHMDILRGKTGWREAVEDYQKEIGGRVAYFGLGSGLMNTDIASMIAIIKQGVEYNKAHGLPAPFIVADYLQLLNVDGKEEQEAMKAAMAQLKTIAVEHRAAVIAVVANNRESNKSGEVSMYTTRGSSSAEYGADVIMSLVYTESLRDQEVTDIKKRSLKLTKARAFNPEGMAHFTFDGRYMEFAPTTETGEVIPHAKWDSPKQCKINNDLSGFGRVGKPPAR